MFELFALEGAEVASAGDAWRWILDLDEGGSKLNNDDAGDKDSHIHVRLRIHVLHALIILMTYFPTPPFGRPSLRLPPRQHIIRQPRGLCLALLHHDRAQAWHLMRP